MEIRLETIRNLLRKTLGFDSFSAGFINSVQETDKTPTAAINAKGVMTYNPDFVRKNVKTEADLFCLVFHELLHPAFGHFIYRNDELTNIACDAIINSAISNLFPEESCRGVLFMRLYPQRGIQAILRPDSRLEYSRFKALYEYLYPRYSRQHNRLSAGEVIQTLKALVPETRVSVMLLGSHGDGTGGCLDHDRWPGSLIAKIAGDLLRTIRESGKAAGYCEELQRLLIEVLKPKRTIREDLLLGYATRRKLDAFFDTDQRHRRITSPFPINPSRRDMVLLSAGIWPGFFRNRQPEIVRRQKGIAVFLDVSGSVNEYLPEILGILSGLRNRLSTIYLFSNRVVEVPFAAVCRGELETTHGTDFDCIARTVLEKEYERAVVITDGFADLKEENAGLLRKAGTRILTVLFDGTDECEAFEPFGEVIQLEDMTE